MDECSRKVFMNHMDHKHTTTIPPFFLMLFCSGISLSLAVFSTAQAQVKGPLQLKGPLRVHQDNPRYFSDDTKCPDGSFNAIYLSGFQFWDVFDAKGNPSPDGMQFGEFLTTAEKYGVNFIRLWRWNELTRFQYGQEDATNFSLHPWARTGPGNALDGQPKFDLRRFNQPYFDQLRSRVTLAGKRGLYVAVMLFEGWSLRNAAKPWAAEGHPFHKQNNINGINGDADGDGRVLETHTLRIPGVNVIQEAYVRKVIDTINDLDNVLYEIANEDGVYSVEWQYHLIRTINAYQATKPRRHPVGMTCLGNDDLSPAADMVQVALLNSPADWISPFTKAPPPYDYNDNPPPGNGTKVIVSDTDHLLGTAADRTWVWKSFIRGLNVNNYMELRDLRADTPRLEQARRAMGDTRQYAERINLAAMQPLNDLATTRYCLANPGVEYLVYQPNNGARFSVELKAGRYDYEWFAPADGKTMRGGNLKATGGWQPFKAPFDGDAVLYLKRVDRPA